MLQYNRIQCKLYNTAKHNTLLIYAVIANRMCCNKYYNIMIQHGTMIQYDRIQYNRIKIYDMSQYDMIQYDIIKYNLI